MSFGGSMFQSTSTQPVLDDSLLHVPGIHSASYEAAANSTRLASLRDRLLTQGHHLPLSLIQAEIHDFDVDSAPESPVARGSPTVSKRIPPIRVSFKEVGIGGGSVTSERWYPCATDTPTSVRVIDYTSKGKAKDVSRLAKEYETTEVIESPLGAGINTPLPRHYKRSFPSFEPYARRQTRTANVHPSIKESLMKHAPWIPKEVPRQPTPPPPEPSALLELAQRNLTPETLQGVLMELQMNPVLTHVDLSYNALGDEGVIALSHSLMCHKGIRRIKLVGCCIGDAGASALANLLHESHVVELDLRWNGICQDGAYLLKKRINYAPNLRSLRLRAPKQQFLLRFAEGERLGVRINQVAMVQEVYVDSPAANAEHYNSDDEEEEEEEEEEEDPEKEPHLIPGMVICEVDGTRVKTDLAVKEAVEDCEDEVVLTVRSNNARSKLIDRIEEKLEEDEEEEEEEEGEEEEEA